MRHPAPRLTQYRILGQIGEGQFGQVYCALHRQTGELVAIKRLDLQGFPTNQFIREMAFLLSLKHPNIVSCKGMQYQKNDRYLITDYCEGGTLRDLIELQGEITLFQRLKLISDILKGLDYAHQQKIIHCDLKPENILLTVESSGWQARITDFGIARLQEWGNQNTGRGYTGSPAYMAPERFYGRFSVHSDIYAVGVMLYEILIGKRPFSGLPGQLMVAHLNQRIEMPTHLPKVFYPIIIKALEKLPQRRYDSANEMLIKLENAISSLPKSLIFSGMKSGLSFPHSFCQLKLLRYTPLAFQVTHLAVKDRQIYLAFDKQLWCQIYPSDQVEGFPCQEWQILFNHSIVALEVGKQGCFILSKGKQKFYLYQIPFNPISAHAVAEDFLLTSWTATKFTFTLDPEGHWLGMVYRPTEDKSSTVFQLLKLPELKLLKAPIAFSYPIYFAFLDQRHGIAFHLYQRGEEWQTRFKFFNRRGAIISGLTLPFGLYNITTHKTLPYCLFATDIAHRSLGFVIQLKPWKISKISLEIEIDFIAPHVMGFCVANQQGTLIILDNQGIRINQCLLAIEGKMTAMTMANHTQLLITTWHKKQGKLYYFDFRKLLENAEDE